MITPLQLISSGQYVKYVCLVAMRTGCPERLVTFPRDSIRSPILINILRLSIITNLLKVVEWIMNVLNATRPQLMLLIRDDGEQCV